MALLAALTDAGAGVSEIKRGPWFRDEEHGLQGAGGQAREPQSQEMGHGDRRGLGRRQDQASQIRLSKIPGDPSRTEFLDLDPNVSLLVIYGGASLDLLPEP